MTPDFSIKNLDTLRNTDELLAIGNETITPNYAPQPVIFTHGKGTTLWDHDGKAYLDCIAGIAVSALGHAHPELTQALQDQVAKLLHTSNLYFNENQILLQEMLSKCCFADRFFFANSGAEANEAAIKLARRYQKSVAGRSTKVNIVAAHQSFHGRTMGAIAATGQPKYWEGFEPLPPAFQHVPFNDVDALASVVDDDTCAVLLEPLQGESGVRPAAPGYFQAVREICDRTGAILILDEVQCGVGRLGTLWAYEQLGIEPDIATWAKGIAGGVPMGIMAVREKHAHGFQKASHATTFGGNPLACRAALVVLQTLQQPGFLNNVQIQGEALRQGLRRLQESQPAIVDVRGAGLLVGAELKAGLALPVVGAARERGLLVNMAGPNTIRFAPPLIVNEDDIECAIQRFAAALAACDRP